MGIRLVHAGSSRLPLPAIGVLQPAVSGVPYGLTGGTT